MMTITGAIQQSATSGRLQLYPKNLYTIIQAPQINHGIIETFCEITLGQNATFHPETP